MKTDLPTTMNHERAVPLGPESFRDGRILRLVIGGDGRWVDIHLSADPPMEEDSAAGSGASPAWPGARLLLRSVCGLRYEATRFDGAEGAPPTVALSDSREHVTDGVLDLGTWGTLRWQEADLRLAPNPAETSPLALAAAPTEAERREAVRRDQSRPTLLPTTLHDAWIERVVVSAGGTSLRIELSLLTLLAHSPPEARDQIFECSAVLLARQMQGFRLHGPGACRSDRDACISSIRDTTPDGTVARLREIFPGRTEPLGPTLVRLQGEGSLTWHAAEILLELEDGSLEHVGSLSDDR